MNYKQDTPLEFPCKSMQLLPAIQDLHKTRVHVSSVPRPCVPSEILTAMCNRTESWSRMRPYCSNIEDMP